MTNPDVSAPAPSAERRAQLEASAKRLATDVMCAIRARHQPYARAMEDWRRRDFANRDEIEPIILTALLRSDAERSTTPPPCAGPTREQVEALPLPIHNQSLGFRLGFMSAIERVLDLFQEAERHG